MSPQNKSDNIKMDGKYRRLPGGQTPSETPAPPAPTSSNSCYLPAELQMIILETADWKLHPILAQVCRFWRHFIQTSPKVRLNRYFPVEATTYGFDSSPGEEEFPRPRPWVHKSLAYLRQFIVDTTTLQKSSFRPCKIELLEWPPPPRPSCRIWPDMHWGLFKDDLVTIFPGRDSDSLKIAEREIVVSFDCCDFCESTGDKQNQVVPLGPVAKVASYLSFVTEQVNYDMMRCLRKRKEKKWDEGTVVEFWMGREPILVFSPRGYDTDTLRLWFEVKVRLCNIDWFA
ncbi:uncharacterized protein DFL_005814 [Arthrobotrys flagrans]|uniref:F-box domain-containing protein n=1 Tax=Arthrobotrys flagrans TaxID=97331 RepID=A0A436ZZ56_ARTFL|nr:hypothetical protein DFL_005814 [Arthrobotrys flagrans]